MNNREKLELLIKYDGHCDDIKSYILDCPNCPIHAEYNHHICSVGSCTNHKKILACAKDMLQKNLTTWQPLEVDNLPPNILTGDYEFNYYADHDTKWHNEDELPTDVIGDLVDGCKYRYRRRQPEPPSVRPVEELANLYVGDINYYQIVYPPMRNKIVLYTKDDMEESYIAGYKAKEAEDE